MSRALPRPVQNKVLWSAGVMSLMLCTSAWAVDTVVVRNDKPKRGNVKTTTPQSLTLESGAGSVKKTETVPANEIIHVSFDGEPPTLRLARSLEDQGNLPKALESYQSALEKVAAGKDLLKAELEFLIARVQAKQAKADPTLMEAARTALETFQSAHANSYRFYPTVRLLAELHIVAGDYAKAETALNTLDAAKSTFPEYEMLVLISRGRIFLKQNQVTQAQAQFEAAAGKPAKTDSEKARRYEAILGVAACLSQQNQSAEATKRLDEVIKNAPAEDSKVMAEAYLRKGDALLAAGETKDAMLAYLHVDVLFSAEKDLHAEALYKLSSVFTKLGMNVRATDARAQLNNLYGNSEWAKKQGS